eukprot:9804257-Alexandrium_andersonii.AAC.1
MFKLIHVLHMRDFQVGHVLCAHGTVQHEAAQTFRGGMRLWLVGHGPSDRAPSPSWEAHAAKSVPVPASEERSSPQ